MVNTAVADIVSPSVTTEYPLGLLSQELLLLKDFLSCIGAVCCKSCYQSISCCAVLCADREGVDPLLSCCLNFLACCLSNSLDLGLEVCSQGLVCKKHTITELSSILKQGVGPCRAVTLVVYCVRSGR